MSARDEVLARVRRAKGPAEPPPVLRDYRVAGTLGVGDLGLFAERLRDYRARVRVVDADQVAATVVAALLERGVRRVVAAPGTPVEWTALPDQQQLPDQPEPSDQPGQPKPPDQPELSDQQELSEQPEPSDQPELPDQRELSDPVGRVESRDPLGGDLREADAAGVDVIRDPVTVDTLERTDAVVTACHVAIAETGTIVLDHDAADQGPRALTLVPDYHLVVVRADQVVPGVPDAVAALAGVRTQTWISGPSATSDIELERVEGVHGPRTLEVVIVR
ncbi:L-lactate utilization protein LutC [Saccharothrix ecbatanensis]|uniref:L-lactate utilization protein LutC n=1 Tax=Saccharothrix ecbatanensis TaxID=1105145 RepID=A0A7W9HF71_9PSEU|nr:LUD domain-containing protein [Saccharothrix ecbatanensis]MBB5800836.1 L-lactate utilization protein LutC [Saccharothrix ecbatanensis]